MGRIVIAGGTGFVGKKLIHKLSEQQHEIVVLTRRNSNADTLTKNCTLVQWGSEMNEWKQCIDGADAVINLAGASVAQRSNYCCKTTASFFLFSFCRGLLW